MGMESAVELGALLFGQLDVIWLSRDAIPEVLNHKNLLRRRQVVES
jgi:hypothetical protein